MISGLVTLLELWSHRGRGEDVTVLTLPIQQHCTIGNHLCLFWFMVMQSGSLLWLLQVVKRIWVHIREHDLQNPKDRRKIIPDEVLGTFLTAPVNMMSMNSQLSKHCFTKGIPRDW